MPNPYNRTWLLWLSVQLALFLVFVMLAQAVPVSGAIRFSGAVVLAVIVRWLMFAIWMNRRSGVEVGFGPLTKHRRGVREGVIVPRTIILFECAAYLSLLIGLISMGVNWSVLPKTHGPAFFVLTVLITILIQVLLMRLIARRKNWARWTFVVLVFVGTLTAGATEFVHRTPHNGVAGSVAFYLSYLAGLVATYFLLTSDAWAWFRLSREGKRADF